MSRYESENECGLAQGSQSDALPQPNLCDDIGTELTPEQHQFAAALGPILARLWDDESTRIVEK